jgi:integrase
MARPRKPWYRQSRNTWYVWIDGKQHNLGPDKEEALRRYHTIMSEAPEKPSSGSIAALLDAFVVYCAEYKSPSTLRWYEDYLQDFLDYLKSNGHAPGSLAPSRLTPRLVRAWADQRGRAKRARITAVKAAYRWGHAEGWIEANPIAAMRRPAQTKREGMVSLKEMKAILRLSSKPFRDLLVVSWDTGARPQELRRLKDIHLDLGNHRCVLPVPEAKGKKRNRVIYFTPRAERIITRLNHGGFIFRNADGNQWTASAVKCRFARLDEKLGRRFCQYHFRHSFATRKLKDGISPIVVAELLGHADVSTLAKVDQHIAQDPAHLLSALNAKPT